MPNINDSHVGISWLDSESSGSPKISHEFLIHQRAGETSGSQGFRDLLGETTRGGEPFPNVFAGGPSWHIQVIGHPEVEFNEDISGCCGVFHGMVSRYHDV